LNNSDSDAHSLKTFDSQSVPAAKFTLPLLPPFSWTVYSLRGYHCSGQLGYTRTYSMNGRKIKHVNDIVNE